MRLLRWGPPVVLLAALLAGAVWKLWRDAPQSNTSQKKFDVILVLGSPCKRDGSPSPVQRERVLEGVREWRRGVAPRIIFSGKAAHNQWIEAVSMGRLARQQGVPAEDVIEEPQAYNTIENIYYSVAIMQAHGWHSVEVVSSWNHLPRAARILGHFPVAWRTQAAPWPKDLTVLRDYARDWVEALYSMKLRLFGFPQSQFIRN